MKKNDFKETEIGKIPDDWDVVMLSDISEKVTDGSHFSPKEVKDGKKIIATVKDMQYSGFSFDTCKRISDEAFDSLVKNGCSPEKGDILISKDGANCLDIIFVYNQDEKIVLLSSIAIVRLKKGFNSQFYRYYLLSPIAQKIMKDGFVSGSAIPRVILKNFKRVPVPRLPDIKTQNSIATLLTSLDSMIELNHKMNQNLEQIEQTLFKHWFVNFEFPNEQGKPYKSSGGKMVDSELGKIPEGWKIKTIQDVVESKGGTTPSTSNKEYWENGQISWCTPKDLSRLELPILLETERKITKSGLSCISSGLLPPGVVLLSSRAPIGYLAISQIPVSINQGFIAIICNKGVSNYYMLFWAKQNMGQIKNMAHGTTFEEINKASFRSMNIVLPPQAILNEFDRLIHNLYLKMVKNEEETHHIIDIRDSLLPKLMSGEIRVRVDAA